VHEWNFNGEEDKVIECKECNGSSQHLQQANEIQKRTPVSQKPSQLHQIEFLSTATIPKEVQCDCNL
jgi:hypothetical protein